MSRQDEDEKDIGQDGERITVPPRSMNEQQREMARRYSDHMSADDGPSDEEIEAARRAWMQRTADAWRQSSFTLTKSAGSDLPPSSYPTQNRPQPESDLPQKGHPA